MKIMQKRVNTDVFISTLECEILLLCLGARINSINSLVEEPANGVVCSRFKLHRSQLQLGRVCESCESAAAKDGDEKSRWRRRQRLRLYVFKLNLRAFDALCCTFRTKLRLRLVVRAEVCAQFAPVVIAMDFAYEFRPSGFFSSLASEHNEFWPARGKGNIIFEFIMFHKLLFSHSHIMKHSKTS